MVARHLLFHSAILATVFVGCGYPSIGEDPEIKLPDRERRVGDVPDDTADGGGDPGTPKPTTTDVTLTVTLNGEGNITSTPSGVTCTGTTCKGTFKPGTSVTLTAVPKQGSLFQGWSGACTGASCAPVLNADTQITAQFPKLDGTWTGTYTQTRQNSGCTFNNAGNLNVTFASTQTVATSAQCTGLEIRSLPSCALVEKRNGTAPQSDVTIDTTKPAVTGTWTMSVPGISGTLAMPFVATIDGAKITGSWTCQTCTGSFTLTRQ
jgi:hypothetical protein